MAHAREPSAAPCAAYNAVPNLVPVAPCWPRCRHVDTYRHHVERSKDERLDRKDGTGRG